ncbi:YcxB family protein [Stratiformator vulcanicus]|uniref:YcxB-like C-terminal domain-containing protein n=1 Tax=Stratiformator vulcanicus TaxID=2527980 RepID=A0A517R0U6_9PLAN|nr:YcxB family protein [Stratiformator vulcanicus]QDT37476.1 hypothetical protein Pan189_18560 [Stratiformator vulcanicus]
MTVRFELSAEDVAEFSVYLYSRSPEGRAARSRQLRTAITFAVVAALLFAGLQWIQTTESAGLATLFSTGGSIMAMLAFLVFLGWRRTSMSAIRSAAEQLAGTKNALISVEGPYELTVDDRGVRQTADGLDDFLAWRRHARFDESDSHFFLLRTFHAMNNAVGATATIIPKRAFDSPESIDQFAQYVRQRLEDQAIDLDDSDFS